jgi:4-amino-4-deoxy-L-arabinose transferase-like glycosyltransferase
MRTDSTDGARWLPVLALVVAMVVFGYPVLLGIPLLDPDEGIHASIAQEMVERGNWVTPTLFGEPFLDKPIAYFWAQVVSLRFLGMNEAAVRLPGLVLGLLGAMTTAAIAWRMFGRTPGLLAGLFYATMILPTALVQAPAHDVALVPSVNLAILAFWESDRTVTRRAAAAWTLAAGLLLGLACLTKGLVGIALVGVAYGSHLLLTARLRPAACVRAVAALTIAALMAAPWYAAMEVQNPGYLSYFFIDRHLRGFTTTTQPHGSRPWWYHLPLLLGGGLPWIAYLPVAAQQWWLRRRERDRAGADGRRSLLWCWLIGGTLFLSLGHSKLVTYIWPVFPPIAVLAAATWNDLLTDRLAPTARRTLSAIFWGACLLGPLTLPGAMVVAQSQFDVQFPWFLWIAAIPVALGTWLPAGFWYRGRAKATVVAAILVTLVHFAWIMALLLPRVAAVTAGRDLSEYFNHLGAVPSQVMIVEERVGSVVFYLAPELRSRLQKDQITSVRARDVMKQPAVKADAVIVIAEQQIETANARIGLPDMAFDRAGRYRVYRAAAITGNPPTS